MILEVIYLRKNPDIIKITCSPPTDKQPQYKYNVIVNSYNDVVQCIEENAANEEESTKVLQEFVENDYYLHKQEKERR